MAAGRRIAGLAGKKPHGTCPVVCAANPTPPPLPLFPPSPPPFFSSLLSVQVPLPRTHPPSSFYPTYEYWYGLCTTS